MKSSFLIVMALVVFCSMLMGINELQYPLLIMQFKSTVAPFISNGVVNVGITSIDSLNTKYKANYYEYQNIPGSQYIRDILLMTFANGNSIDLNLLLQEYRTYGLQYCNFVEIQSDALKPSELVNASEINCKQHRQNYMRSES